jgi:DNA primase large subunit
MLESSIDENSFFQKALTARRAEELHPDGHQIWKTITIKEFPTGVEVLLNEKYETWSDGANFEDKEKSNRGEGDREKNLERAGRRAKTQVRSRCKMIQADQMLTLVYRENMQDEKRLQADFKAFIKRLRALGPFEYVAGIEKQKRGALHLHIACQAFPKWMANKDGVKVKSFNLIRSIWRSVVGADNGNVDLTKPRRNASHRIACYIAKYISEGLEDAVFNAKSYWSSRGILKPKVIRLTFPGSTATWDLVVLLVQDFNLRGFSDLAQYSNRIGAFYWFAASKP